MRPYRAHTVAEPGLSARGLILRQTHATTFALWGGMTLPRDARTYRALGAGWCFLIVQATSHPAEAQSTRRVLDNVRFEVAAVTDSAQYLLYQYRIVNPASSHGGVGGVRVDLSAPLGTKRVDLPSTGELERNSSPSELDHVPVGLIGPERWRMTVLPYNAYVYWYAADYGVVVNGVGLPASADSAPAGESKDGFGLRSPYLPGIRRFEAQPTFQSCCTEPNAQGEYPLPTEFPVPGFTVAPTVRPQDMSLRLVQSDLQQTCGPLRWIADGAVCRSLRSNLARAIASQQGDRSAAVSSLRTFLSELEGSHGAGKPVTDNAYWLLKVNGEYLLKQM